MDTHQNGSLTPKGREAMVRSVIEDGLSKASAARRFNTTPKTPNGSGVSAPRAWPACRTVHRSRAHRQARQRPPSARRSRLCEDSAIPARRSPPRSAFRRQLSAASLNAGASTACRRSSRPNRSVAMNGQPPARSSTSTSKSWASSVGLAIGSRTSGPARAIRAGVGWEHVHLAIDDHSSLAHSEILPDEKRRSCLRFLFNSSTP